MSLIQGAQLHFSSACVEDIKYHADWKLDKALISRLATCTYVQDRHNIIVLGASGVGKIYKACAFGIVASRNFFHAKYIRLPNLLNDLAVAYGIGNYQKVMKQYQMAKLLILDEWLLLP